jgi:hypothetical protein
MTKGRFFLFILSLSIIFSLESCADCIQGEGASIKESRAIVDFEVLKLDCSVNVEIRENLVSEKNRVEVEAPENLLPYIKSISEGKKLTISIEGCVNSISPLTVRVYTNGMQKLINNGSGNVLCLNALKGDQLVLVNNGSGDMTIQFKGKEVEIENDGSGDVEISGGSGELEIESNGSGNVTASEFKADKASIDNSGSGNVVVSVKSALSINLSGSGDVRYRGNPQQLEQSNDGSGSIVKLN